MHGVGTTSADAPRELQPATLESSGIARRRARDTSARERTHPCAPFNDLRISMPPIATIPLSALRTTASRQPAHADARGRTADIEALFDLPFMDLLFRAQQVHREHF